MENKTSRIPAEVLKEIFPKKFKRNLASERVYSQLKQMILSGKLKKGQNLMQDGIAQTFGVSKMAVTVAISRLKKEKLIISRRGIGSIVVSRAF